MFPMRAHIRRNVGYLAICSGVLAIALWLIPIDEDWPRLLSLGLVLEQRASSYSEIAAMAEEAEAVVKSDRSQRCGDRRK